MTDSDPSRRQLLLISGGALTLGVAGCLDASDDNPSGGPEAEQEHVEADDDHGEHGQDGDDSSGSHDHDHELGHPESAVEIEMVSDDGEHFMPHVVHVEAGGSIEWLLESGSHDTTAYHPDTHGEDRRIPEEAEPWQSDSMDDEGDSFERTFDVEGVYDYVCTPHEAEGMVGTVVVGWPDPEDQPGLESPSDDLPESAIEQLEEYNEQVREVLEAGDDHDDDHHDDDHHDDH